MSSQPSSPVDTSSLPELVTDRDNRRLYSVDCKFSPTDLALATPPGQDHYDPASTIFPDEELKPQPIIKKSRKNFVPDNMKDDKYWARRHKNNIAAKRSREARRLKENQIVLRASYLEKENNSLKEDVMRLKAENDMLKNQLKEFQSWEQFCFIHKFFILHLHISVSRKGNKIFFDEVDFNKFYIFNYCVLKHLFLFNFFFF